MRPAAPSDWDEKEPDRYLEELKSAISGLPGWELRPSVILTLFSFFKGVIFQDLQENAQRVVTHSIVQTLAGPPPLSPNGAPLVGKNPADQQELQNDWQR